MAKVYERINFQNTPSTATPLNAENLNKMDKAIDDLDNKVVELEGYEETVNKAAQEAVEVAESAKEAVNKTVEDAENTLDAEVKAAQIAIDKKVADVDFYTKRDADIKYGSVIVQKASGSDILVKDGSNRPFQNFASYGKSEQTQYTGKNQLNNTAANFSGNGVTRTVNDNKSITVNGSPTGNASFVKLTQTIKAGEWIFSGCPKGGSSTTYSQMISLDGDLSYLYDYGEGVEFELEKDTDVVMYLARIRNGYTATNLVFYPMIRPSGTDDTYEPYVGGTASPNPDYPQRIGAVGDKGYFDGELLQGAYGASDGVFASNTAYVCNKNIIPCNGQDKITLQYEINAYMVMLFYDENKNYLSYTTNNANALTKTLTVNAPANAKYFNFNINGAGITPANAKHICVTINGKYALIVKNCNKNLLENSATSQTVGGLTFTVNEDKSVKVSGTTTGANNFVIKNVTLPAGTYILSGMKNVSGSTEMQLRIYGGTTMYAQLPAGTDSKSFTLTAETTVQVYINFNTVGITYSGTIYPMLRKAEITDDTYVPHEHQTTYISIAQPLKGIGDSADSVKGIDGLYGENRKFVALIFDGSDDEGWNGMTSYSDRFFIPSSKLSNIKAKTKVLCSHYTYATSLATVDYGIYLGSDLNVKNKDITTLADFKAALAANPITVVLELKNEITESFTDQTPFYSMKTFDGVTHISASDDAYMEIEYATDTKTYIDNKFAELSAALLNN